jgi:transcriptional regulator with XRE-family HTH domain
MTQKGGKSIRAVPDGSTFHERLASIIKRFQSRYALAQKAGVAESTIQTWMNGRSEPSDAVLRVADAARVNIRWLLTGGGEPAPPAAVDKHRLAIAIRDVFEVLAETETATDAITAAEFIVEYYADWERTGRQPPRKRLLSLVPKRR